MRGGVVARCHRSGMEYAARGAEDGYTLGDTFDGKAQLLRCHLS